MPDTFLANETTMCLWEKTLSCQHMDFKWHARLIDLWPKSARKETAPCLTKYTTHAWRCDSRLLNRCLCLLYLSFFSSSLILLALGSSDAMLQCESALSNTVQAPCWANEASSEVVDSSLDSNHFNESIYKTAQNCSFTNGTETVKAVLYIIIRWHLGTYWFLFRFN